ncbi:class I SAM-dependent methyltransferase [Streptomyces sp. V4-01]|uniref:Class I SAM-dependent methyltransferase n=1 Tax=Actinacidiphila polyblastidii TaxID=3110430 RepID=A0ABU7PER7_9ACTN|nr:class I SAM-dependent methyltransferase [Streptomyces sp. V4-01]
MTGLLREGFGATGPGAVTPDGCAVELYERLPAGDQPAVIAAAVPAGARILELGCGAGRMTHPLVDLGFDVTAVDESAEMLAKVHGARTVHSSIQTLDLGTRFDVVLLASFLVHAHDPRVRHELLASCRRHVADGGCVLLQREGQGWHENLPRESPLGSDGVARVLSSEPAGPGVRSVHVEYVYPDARWTQTFLSRPLTAEEFESALTAAGLAADATLTPDGVWVRALPV